MTSIAVLLAITVLLCVGMCGLWVRLIKRRERRVREEEKEFKESVNYDNRKN